MRQDLHDTLIRIGFSSRQAHMYLFILERSSVRVAEVAEALSLARSSCHDALQELVRLGIVKEESAGDQKRYIAVSAETIAQILESSAREAEHRATLARQAVATFELFAQSAPLVDGRMRVMRTQGEEGVRKIREIFCALPDATVFHACGYDGFLSSSLPSLEGYFNDLLAQGKRIEAVHGVSRSAAHMHSTSEALSLSRIPREIGEFPGEILVCDTIVAFIPYSPPFHGLVLFSAEMAQMCRILFTLAQREAKRIHEAYPVV